MEKVVLIVKKTYIDDSDASMAIDVKVRDSIEAAKASILYELNKEFETSCNSFAELACVLADGGIDAKVEGDGTNDSFCWYDNGKGEEFHICEAGFDYINISFG